MSGYGRLLPHARLWTGRRDVATWPDLPVSQVDPKRPAVTGGFVTYIVGAPDLKNSYGGLVESNPYRHLFNKPSELRTPAMSMICSR